uniref:Putative plant transposon protein domain-containing protein n=1 Tax=Chenopodium quinoa TaxID=63459 RepID=A0A803LEB1_CHEQI
MDNYWSVETILHEECMNAYEETVLDNNEFEGLTICSDEDDFYNADVLLEEEYNWAENAGYMSEYTNINHGDNQTTGNHNESIHTNHIEGNTFATEGNRTMETQKAAFIANFQESSGTKTGWGAVIVAELVALVVADFSSSQIPTPSVPVNPSAEVTSSFPSSWFRNNTSHGKGKDGFHSWKLCFSELMDIEFISSAQSHSLKVFRESNMFKLSSVSDVAYPRLTRLFYINMVVKRSCGEITLDTLVKGREISLNSSILAQILGTSPDFSRDSHPSRLECVTQAKEQQFLLPNLSSSHQLTHFSLRLEPKILFTYLVRCIVPRTNSRELLTDQTLDILFLLFNGYDLDFPFLILNHMVHCFSSSRLMPLPYANLLPKIFQFFNISLENEEVERIQSPKVGLDFLPKSAFCVSRWLLESFALTLLQRKLLPYPPLCLRGKALLTLPYPLLA